VTVNGLPATTPDALVGEEVPVRVVAGGRAFVSRGGHKLAAAIDRFGVEVEDLVCLDAGASTGGFTDCLLQRGAANVYAVDVAYGQLAWEIRTDPRVVVMERTNIRALTSADLPVLPAVVVADLSFISLRTALPALCALEPLTLILLVKPQFETARADVGQGGVVRDPRQWRRALTGVLEVARGHGAHAAGVMASPLLGPSGNVEFLLHLRRAAAGAAGPDLDAAIAEGEALRG
jgi:23S rRNA (cytidine1920-2'-O)/16S rRNA (cytidine1409-2'-O)-methyltransferase